MKEMLSKGFWVLLSGLSIGWMVGLSTSSTIKTLLSVLIATLVSLVSALAGLDKKVTASQAAPTGSSTTHPEKPKKPAKPPTPAVSKAPAEANPAAEVKAPADVKHPPEPQPSVEPKARGLPVVHPAPVALLVLGIAVGSSFGVYAQTHKWLGEDGQTQELKRIIKQLKSNQAATQKHSKAMSAVARGLQKLRNRATPTQSKVLWGQIKKLLAALVRQGKAKVEQSRKLRESVEKMLKQRSKSSRLPVLRLTKRARTFCVDVARLRGNPTQLKALLEARDHQGHGFRISLAKVRKVCPTFKCLQSFAGEATCLSP